jgi:hypothetical protein
VAAPLLGNGIFVDGGAKCVLSSAVRDVFHAGVHERHADAGQTGHVSHDPPDSFRVVMNLHTILPSLFLFHYTPFGKKMQQFVRIFYCIFEKRWYN